jgi:2-polyprenyl-3-methyl-5-hydroxy-6-metoxy-1,4-benzoquinol methylase
MDFERLRRNWENLGRKDPMWAILTAPGTEGGRWDEQAFFQTGVEFVDWLGAWLVHHGIDLPHGDALDFGCGIGRLTQAMAPHSASATGVDVSQPMIELAAQKNRHGDAVRYVCNTRPDLSVFPDGSFDFVLSAIVLQHMRAEYSLRYLAEFLRVLRPGGLLFFQMATAELVSGAAPEAPVDEAPDETHMEIHCVPIARIHDTLATGGAEVLVEERDQWAGDSWESVHFAVRRSVDV